MVVLTDKELVPPPPPYFALEHARPPGAPAAPVRTTPRPAAPPLPAHLVLQIVFMTLERARARDPESADERARRTTRTLYWIGAGLRLVNRGFYLASMHVLRSTYLPAYSSMVRAPYSSDPFPRTSASAAAVAGIQRESRILDLFLLFRLHEDVFTDDSSLHLGRPDALRDLFAFMQPRARLEDLVRDYAVSAGLVSILPPAQPSTSRFPVCPSTASLPPPFASPAVPAVPPTSPAASSSKAPSAGRRPTPTTALHPHTPVRMHPRALPFAALSASFSTRRAGLVLLTRAGRRTIIETARERSEPLERCASRLVVALKAWLDRDAP